MFQPSSWVGSAATPFPLGRFLGGHPEIYGSFHAHILAETLGRKWGANEERTLDLGVREQKDRSKVVKKQVAAGGVKPKLLLHFIMAVATW